MGLAGQQGPLAPGASGAFLVPKPLPERLLYAESQRRRMRVMLGGQPIAESDDVIVLHEPARYPVAYFPKSSILQDALVVTDRRTDHPDLGETTWFEVRGGDESAPRGAWEHTGLQPFARMLENRVAFAWTAMDGFYERTSASSGTQPMPTTASASAKAPAISRSAATGHSSSRPTGRSCCTSRASLPGGTCHAATSPTVC